MTKPQIVIIGAGLAGLLAGTMMRHRATIVEKQRSLPNNHHALLRFRSNVFSTATGIPFKKVRMIKAVYGDKSNPIKAELSYAKKTIGQYRSDRSLPVGVVKEDRYVAPSNLIEQLAELCHIEFGIDEIQQWGKDMFGKVINYDNNLIYVSTIPMPDLMEALDYPKKPKFNYRGGSTIIADVHNCDAYVTYYFPDNNHAAYRASITGSKLIIELAESGRAEEQDNESNANGIASYYAQALGIASNEINNASYHRMKYAKILPIDDNIRKDFMHWATVNYNIYSLGRFATWRPGLLLDDLVNDVNLINRWSMEGGKYNAARHWK